MSVASMVACCRHNGEYVPFKAREPDFVQQIPFAKATKLNQQILETEQLFIVLLPL